MLKLFTPTWLKERFSDIPVSFFVKHNIKTIFTDLDNTLISPKNPNATQELTKWINEMKEAGIQVVLVSNNKSSRIEKVAKQVEVPFVYPALKPFHKGLEQAMSVVKCPKEQIVMMGDQLMTDVLGGTTFGLKTILVKPLDKNDGLGTRINRVFEKMILKALYGKNLAMLWEVKSND
ncbi:hypothetical protein SAMN05421767_10557 [Granulicatella balaenopterae]|uniref:YqeG family HAD IIIA-type phosphatase n=1 Tax=Granulicatella balaenopterae TaxID=137733 RepID=A0A1H9IE18_9LACT|nr:YqeG family HAD IIIA-type phosphatase [Granulicatella balaenopterae]SEQ72784.1 hypothetical protein SAMN05421767_10557 [Granulicatella balaenopterae]